MVTHHLETKPSRTLFSGGSINTIVTMALLATQNVNKFGPLSRLSSCLDCDFHYPGRIKARGSPFWEFDGASLCVQFNCLLLEGVFSIYDS